MNPMNREPAPLKNNNPRGDPSRALRCDVKTRSGTSCRCPAVVELLVRMPGLSDDDYNGLADLAGPVFARILDGLSLERR
jgi:hypothetical protein